MNMRLTTKRRYAVTAMLDLALHQSQGAVALKEIALRQKISVNYLEQLFAKLRKAGLVQSVRGSRGGYLLAKELSQITVAEVINAVEDHLLERNKCGGLCSCQNSVPCLTNKLWSELNKVMFDFLNNKTFSDLVAQNSGEGK